MSVCTNMESSKIPFLSNQFLRLYCGPGVGARNSTVHATHTRRWRAELPWRRPTVAFFPVQN